MSTTSTTTDANGRAQTTLILGSQSGTNTVHVSVERSSDTVTFNDTVVINIPDANLRAKIEIALNKQAGDPITAAEMATLTRLHASSSNISILTGLEYATNLTYLSLGNNMIANISAVPGLTNLTYLALNSNSISDISAVAALTNLTSLNLSSNSISDIASLVANTGLGSGDTVYVRANPLSYPSIYTHIPILQSRSVTVNFNTRTPTTLLKISGDNQQGALNTALPSPFVVEVQDQDSKVFEGVPVTFTITAGGGTLSTTSPRTDTNGRAENQLTLGSKPGSNTVRASVAGISEPVTFNTEASTNVNLPDANLSAL